MVVRLAMADRHADLDADVEFRHLAQAIYRPDRAAGPDLQLRPRSGYGPLLKNRPTLIVWQRRRFVMNRGTDMATPYLRDVLRFIGLRDPRFVPIGPTVGPAAPAQAAREAAHRRLSEIAPGF